MISVITNRQEYFENLGWHEFSTVGFSLEILEAQDIVITDLETTGLGFMFSDIWCLQLGTIDDEHQFIIDTMSVEIEYYKGILENKSLLGHNINFDLVFLFACGIIPKKVICTHVNEYILTAGLNPVEHPRNLGHVVKKYTGIDVDKDDQKDIAETGLDSVSKILYSGNDVRGYLYEVHRLQRQRMGIYSLEPVADLHYRFIRVAAYMELCGMYLDKDKWRAKMEEDIWAKITAQKELSVYMAGIKDKDDNYVVEPHYPELAEAYGIEGKVHDEFSWNATKNVGELFKDIGIDITNPKDDSKETIDIGVLIKQAEEYPILKIYKKYKEAEKRINTYGLDWIEDTTKGKQRKFAPAATQSDGRIHTKTKLMVDTGRTGSGNSRGHNSFKNMQNLPSDAETRSCFVGQGPNRLITCDYSSQESVILADVSQEPNLLKFYQSGGADLHSYVASLIWPEYTLEERLAAKDAKDTGAKLTEDQKLILKQRQMAKGAGFAIAYGGSGFTIANNLNIEQYIGDQVYSDYMKAFPGLSKFFSKCITDMWTEGFIRVPGPYGWIRFIDDFGKLKGFKFKTEKRGRKRSKEEFNKIRKRVGGLEREAINSRIQGLAGMMSKLAGVYFLEEIERRKLWMKVRIVNFVHDEWVAEAHQKTAPKVAPILSECMERAAREILITLDVRANSVVGKEWDH